MGAIAALFFIPLHPHLVEKFISIDIVKQYTITAKYLPGRMKGVLSQFQELSDKLEKGDPVAPMTYHEARDKLVKTYGGSIDEKDAEILLIRGLKKRSDHADQWEYSRDLRTIIRPYLFSDFTTEQTKAVARGIFCPFLLIKAKHSVSAETELHGEFFDIYRKTSKDFRYFEVEGRHHVHLTEPELVAPLIIDFLFSSLPSKL